MEGSNKLYHLLRQKEHFQDICSHSGIWDWCSGKALKKILCDELHSCVQHLKKQLWESHMMYSCVLADSCMFLFFGVLIVRRYSEVCAVLSPLPLSFPGEAVRREWNSSERWRGREVAALLMSVNFVFECSEGLIEFYKKRLCI